mmetsp:Transcript_17542/g.42176  ORF Transcript_17542/g.42176 Transcript_17542/m.42176 type:complete len:209 (-) Transcript_17542:425-1051(-)
MGMTGRDAGGSPFGRQRRGDLLRGVSLGAGGLEPLLSGGLSSSGGPAAPPSAEGGGGSSRFSSRFGTSAIGGRRDDDDGLAVRRMLNLGPSSFFLRDCAPPGGLSEKKSESSFSFVLQRLPPPLDIRLVDVPLPATASSCVPPASFSIFSTERLPYPNRSFRRWDRDDDEDDGDAPDLAPPEEEEEGGLSQRSGRFDSGDNSFFALPS